MVSYTSCTVWWQILIPRGNLEEILLLLLSHSLPQCTVTAAVATGSGVDLCWLGTLKHNLFSLEGDQCKLPC